MSSSTPTSNTPSRETQPDRPPPSTSSSDAASAQADVSPSKIAEPNPGTHQGETETASALRTLFGENGGMSIGQDGEDVVGLGTLGGQQRDEIPNIDPALSNMASTSASTSDSPSQLTSNKRKATSRANMLARGGACEFCKRRKLKCSAEQPACANCTKTGRECVYAQKKQRSRVKMLEDRLQELEKKMGNGEKSGSGSGSGVMEPVYEDHITLAGLELSRFASDQRVIPEPDLMTLADAAASNTRVGAGDATWQTMDVNQVAAELVKAADGQQGVGESMVTHLVRLYINASSMPLIRYAMPPDTLERRLSPSSTAPIHPSLLLALFPSILVLSPYPCFHDPSLPSLLLAQSRQRAVDAIAQGDHRMHDLVIASALRSFAFFNDAKHIEGWVECATSTGLLRAGGFVKLGHVGERFVANLGNYDNELETSMKRLEKERSLRVVMHKGAIVPPCTSSQDLYERINLFWFSYMLDLVSSAGCGWPASYSETDITTPFPKDTTTPSTLLDNSTVRTFLSSEHAFPSTPIPDSDFCAQIKAITLFHRAFHLFDASGSEADVRKEREKISELTSEYMQYLRQVKGEWGPETTEATQAWVLLYATMCILHAKEDFESGYTHKHGHLDRLLDAAQQMLEHTHVVQSSGDPTLQSYTVCLAVIFLIIGRVLITTSQHIITSPYSHTTFGTSISSLRSKADAIKKILEAQGSWLPYARIAVQSLQNVELGTFWKAGEWERGDAGDW
ncbi:hypothetical protein L198_03497 [Cryptococcus wingfieldii CBS 7118]|uniref:Zn(2)-C6 fungal-type domain-containing protein n=1 Tax=Cryptococcus wingfieldii CBS 7118 TaxID=1295528 RepID=A0A1E3JBM9_9TREE|nr:hypothetical protein L198_03497 [Cryptococcus wingfieldii CBS 7118]ODN98254.1 hypothetical protein L198_03497 [Cryptococcus wingfieldii CBS 7118]